MKKNIFASSYLYSHEYLSLEHSYEGLIEVRSYRDNGKCFSHSRRGWQE